MPQGSVIVLAEANLQINYTGGTGNDVVLTALAAAPYVVTNNNDAGAGSLRQAVLDANLHAGTDIIQFDAGLGGTIGLSSGQLSITDNVKIVGQGASVQAVSGNNTSRVFSVNNGTTVSISGLTIRNGNAGSNDKANGQ